MQSVIRFLTILFCDKWNMRAMIIFEVGVIVSLFMKTGSAGDYITFGLCVAMLAVVVVRTGCRIMLFGHDAGPRESPQATRVRERIFDLLFALFFLCLLLFGILNWIG